MWEWSKQLFDKPKNYHSLCDSYTDLLTSETSPEQDSSILSPQHMQEIIRQEIAELGLHNLELRECPYCPQTWSEMAQNSADYQHLRKKFLKLVGYSHQEECLTLGMNEQDIDLLKHSLSPENYNTHLKIPSDFGGKMSLDNLALVQSHPMHDHLHHLIEIQIGHGFLQQHKIIYMPWFEGSFYHG